MFRHNFNREQELYEELLHAITVPMVSVATPSLVLFSLMLRHLSEACELTAELNSEYRMDLKALLKARKICDMRNGEHICPTFVEKEFTSKINSLVAKLKGHQWQFSARFVG